MPNRVDLLNQKRGSSRRTTILGLAVAASLQLAAGCNGTGSTGQDVDLGVGNGEPDLALPPNPPPGSFRVTVTVNGGSGTGSVVSQPGSISCGVGTNACAADFTAGTVVALTAAGTNGSVFSGWSGACAGQGAVCTLTVNADQTASANFGTLSCSPDGVCWEAPLPFGYDLNGVAAISASDVWAVGNSGAAVHYDGKSWTHVQTGTSQDLFDVWARNANDVWATAGAGTMLRWDGTKWNRVSTGFPNDICTYVWGTADRLFVTTALQFVLQYNGTTWLRQDTGTRNDTRLAAITGTSNTDVWVFGFDRYISRYNGAWSSTRPDPAVNPAYGNYTSTSGAWSASATDIWEVTNPGYVARNNPPNGGLGFGFTLQATKVAPGAGFSGLWGTASNSIFTNGPGATLYRYDGTQWNPNPTGVKDVVNLTKVHGTANTDVWAVGQRGVIAHYDGAAATVKRGNVFSGPNMLGVWASGPNDAWFITNAGTVVHYDGASFIESAPLVSGGGAGLKTITGTAPNDIWVGGSNGVNPVFLRYDGTSWKPQTQAQFFNGTAIDTMYAGSKTSAFATGDPSLAVQKWDGTSWKIDTTLTTLVNPISVLWGTGDTNVLAIESASTKLWLYNGAAWTVDSRISAALYSLGGSGKTDIWAGASQAVWHFDGTAWARTALPQAAGNILSVSSVSATDAWAIDSLGGTFHYDGNTWKLMDTGISTASVAKLNAYSVGPQLTWLAGRGILSVRK